MGKLNGSKKDGLESKVMKIPPKLILKNEDGELFIPFCNYSWHRGIVKDPDVCNSRGCKHYSELYIRTSFKY